MEIHVTITDNDFKNGETLTEILTRAFGVAGAQVSVDVYPKAAAEVAAFVPKEITKTQAPTGVGHTEAYLPGGDNSASPEEEDQPDIQSPPKSKPAADVELDENGVPWDAGIHSGGKTFMKTGARKGWWVKRKGLPEEEYLARTEELKAEYCTIDPATDTEDFSAKNAAAGFLPGGDNAPAHEASVASTGTEPAPKYDTGGLTMPVFLQRVGQAQKDGKITKEIVASVLADYEVPSLPMLAAPDHKDKMGGIAAALGLLS